MTLNPMSRIEVRRSTFVLAALYVVALHVVLVAVLWKTNFGLLARKTLGLTPPEERSLDLYRRMLEWAELDDAAAEGALVVLGDSIMLGLDAKDVAADAFGFGLSGATIDVVVEGLPLLRSLGTARAIVVGVGVNDLKYREPAEIARDYASLLAALPPDVPILALSVLPIDERTEAEMGRSFINNNAIRELNRFLRLTCAARPGCAFIDVTAECTDDGGDLRRELHGGDGWHLSPAGNEVLASAIRRALE